MHMAALHVEQCVRSQRRGVGSRRRVRHTHAGAAQQARLPQHGAAVFRPDCSEIRGAVSAGAVRVGQQHAASNAYPAQAAVRCLQSHDSNQRIMEAAGAQ